MKADVQNVSGELIVSGLDSATSLIQAAKNLMNAVVLTVKASYVASTKYPRMKAEAGIKDDNPVVVWKMKVRRLFGRKRVNLNTHHSLIYFKLYGTGSDDSTRYIWAHLSFFLILLTDGANTTACLRS